MCGRAGASQPPKRSVGGEKWHMLVVCLDCFAEWQGDESTNRCKSCGSSDVIALTSDPFDLLLTSESNGSKLPSPIYLYKDGMKWAKLSIRKAARTGRNIR